MKINHLDKRLWLQQNSPREMERESRKGKQKERGAGVLAGLDRATERYWGAQSKSE